MKTAESPSVYFKVFGALILLTILTAATGYIDWGIWNIVITILIAGTKMMLILLFFMHLRESSSLIKIFVVAGGIWFTLLISMSVSDYLTRRWDNPEISPTWIREEATHYLAPKKDPSHTSKRFIP